MICRRCDTLTDNGRCPKCFEQDLRARAMFVTLTKDSRGVRRIVKPPELPPMDAKEALATVARVSSIGLMQK